jgi:hypothetical protein
MDKQWVAGITSLLSSHFIHFVKIGQNHRSRGSSVSIVSDYRLDERGSMPSRGLCVQTSCEAHPASCTMGNGCPFPGSKARPGRDAVHSPPCRGHEWVGAIPPLPCAFMVCIATALPFREKPYHWTSVSELPWAKISSLVWGQNLCRILKHSVDMEISVYRFECCLLDVRRA